MMLLHTYMHGAGRAVQATNTHNDGNCVDSWQLARHVPIASLGRLL